MTVHVTTSAAETGRQTVLTLEGVADEGLMAMLADGIASLASPERRVIVDVEGLTPPTASGGHAFFARLLHERSGGRAVLCAAGDAG